MAEITDASQEPPLEVMMCAQNNNLTEIEKIHLSRLGDRFAYSQKPEYCRPDARYIYRCGFGGCRATINPNGLERSVKAHYRKVHQPLPRAVNVTVHRKDKKIQLIHIPAPKKDAREVQLTPKRQSTMTAPTNLEDCQRGNVESKKMEEERNNEVELEETDPLEDQTGHLSLSSPSEETENCEPPPRTPAKPNYLPKPASPATLKRKLSCKTTAAAKGGKAESAATASFHDELLGQEPPKQPKAGKGKGRKGRPPGRKKTMREDDTSEEDDDDAPEPDLPQPGPPRHNTR